MSLAKSRTRSCSTQGPRASGSQRNMLQRASTGGKGSASAAEASVRKRFLRRDSTLISPPLAKGPPGWRVFSHKMVLHFVAEMMGEGTIHAFKNNYDAELYAAENNGLSLGHVTYAKPPSKVYAVIGGDRGCFVQAASAFPEKALAESAAAKKKTRRGRRGYPTTSL
jgi:hypothetical protein